MTSSPQVRFVAWLMVLLAGWQALISGAGAAELEHRAMAEIRGTNGTSVAASAFPALDTFAATGTFAADGIPGIPAWAVYSASQARATFEFDAAGSRAVQSLVRIYGSGHEKRAVTRYLGSYEIEEHDTKANATASFVRDKTLHRHRLGSALYTSEIVGTAAAVHRLAVVLTDHIGSTDVIVRGTWQASGWTVNGTDSAALNQAAAERQSFDAWGDRRNAANWSELRATDAANRQTSAMDHDRGFTGHEMLDDFGLVHMNGRIYDPEIGRFLSPDPYVQVPEYSQNFNRYSYVLNNPLSYTDPTGYKIDGIWGAVASILIAAVAWYVAPLILGALGAGASITGAGGATISGAGWIAQGAVAGGISGAANAAIAGDNIAKGAFVGAISGAIGGPVNNGAAGILSSNGLLRMAVIATTDGATIEAMGGKFEDGFISSLKFQGSMWTGQHLSGLAHSYMNGRNLKRNQVLTRAEGNEIYDYGYKYFRNQETPTPKDFEFVQAFQDPSSGINVVVLRNIKKGSRIVNYVGTQGSLWGADWITNFMQGFGLRTKQYQQAVEIAQAQAAAALKEGVAIGFVGHSLGGGLAQAAAAATGQPTMIFNSSTLNPSTLRHAGLSHTIPSIGKNVTSYAVSGELLTSLEFLLPIVPPLRSQESYMFPPRGSWSFGNFAMYSLREHSPPMSVPSLKY